MTIESIAPVRSDAGRPLWSVMIPTYHPDIQMLREAMAGPLASGVDRAKMQIALVDDASGVDWKSAPLMTFGQECRDAGIEIHQFDTNIGLAGNWNRCLNLSRGHFVHVLHQDDRVWPDFYDAIVAGFEADPKIGAAFTQHAFITGEGQQIRCGHFQTKTAGIVDDWLEHIFANLAIQCPAIVVKRAVYERLGGFDTGYRYCCDLEMWQRIAREYPLWFDPRPLADFRQHRRSASATLTRRSASWLEVNRCVKEGARQLSAPARRPVMRSFRRYTLRWMIGRARQAIAAGDWRGAFAIIRAAALIVRPNDVYAVMRRRYDRAPVGRPPDRPADPAAQRNLRILLLTDSTYVPWDPVRSVFGAMQRLGRHVRTLDTLGPVDAVIFSPADRPLSQADIAQRSAVVRQSWPLRGLIHFVPTGEAKGFLDRVSDAFWTIRGFVGIVDDAPNMRSCRSQQIEDLERILQQTQPDLVFASRLSSAVPLLRIKSKLPPIVVDFPDVESIRIERLAISKVEPAEIWKTRFGALLAWKAQRRVSAIASSVLVCSELEQRKLQSTYANAHFVTVPNTAVPLGELPPASGPTAIFVGTAWYGPNREATTLGAEGLPFTAGTEILIADNAKEFADACISLFRNPAQAALIGKAAAQRAQSAYEENLTAERLRTVCAGVVRDDRLTNGSRS